MEISMPNNNPNQNNPQQQTDKPGQGGQNNPNEPGRGGQQDQGKMGTGRDQGGQGQREPMKEDEQERERK
jgi:hypothetical protein